MNKIKMLRMPAVSKNPIRWVFDFESWQPTESQWLLATACIQEEEMERIGQFMFKRDAKASLAGRLMIRKFIADNSDLKFNEILLKRDDRGKPYLDGSLKEKLSFSVSHHGRFAVLAGQTDGAVVGVDVMTTKYNGGKDLNDFFRIMSRHFTPCEWDAIKNTSELNEMKMLLFNRHWALKESYVKATGTGIVVDLRNIEFRIRSKKLASNSFITDTELYLDRLKRSDWTFHETLLDCDHLVAVAIGTGQCETSPFLPLNFDELLQDATPLRPGNIQYCNSFMKKDERPY